MERPLLFLDVDGVLNCLDGGHPEHRTPGGLGVWIPPGVTERMDKLLRVFEPVWATAWLGSAHSEWRAIVDPAGLTAWPYVSYSDLKLPAILRYAKERPWVWIELGRLGSASVRSHRPARRPRPKCGYQRILSEPKQVLAEQTAIAEGVM